MTIKRALARAWLRATGRLPNPSGASDPSASAMRALDHHYAGIFASLGGQAPAPAVRSSRADRSFVIAMVPRTGSTMLSLMLQKTLSVGVPDEWLNPGGPLQLHAGRLCSASFTAYWDTLLRTAKTANGYFAIKADYSHLRPLIQAGAVEACLPAPRYAFLTRNDVVAQAISLQRAKSSGLWHNRRKGGRFRPKTAREPVYDRARIDEHVALIRQMEADWRAFFAARGIVPLKLTYEELAADPLAMVERCLDFCNVTTEVSRDALTVDTQKLGDALSEDWRRRYEGDCGSVSA